MKYIIALIFSLTVLTAQDNVNDPTQSAISVYWKTLEPQEKEIFLFLILLRSMIPIRR